MLTKSSPLPGPHACRIAAQPSFGLHVGTAASRRIRASCGAQQQSAIRQRKLQWPTDRSKAPQKILEKRWFDQTGQHACSQAKERCWILDMSQPRCACSAVRRTPADRFSCSSAGPPAVSVCWRGPAVAVIVCVAPERPASPADRWLVVCGRMTSVAIVRAVAAAQTRLLKQCRRSIEHSTAS